MAEPRAYDVRMAEANDEAFELVRLRLEVAAEAVAKGYMRFKSRAGSRPANMILFFRDTNGNTYRKSVSFTAPYAARAGLPRLRSRTRSTTGLIS